MFVCVLASHTAQLHVTQRQVLARCKVVVIDQVTTALSNESTYEHARVSIPIMSYLCPGSPRANDM